MKQEKHPTARELWGERSRSTQDGIDYILNEVLFEIMVANSTLEDMYRSDPGAVGEYAAGIVGYLDGLWDYAGDLFLVNGQWHEPRVGMNDEGIISHHVKTDVCNAARSNGFMVKPVPRGEDGEELPRVGLSFVVAQVPISSPSIQGHFELLAFAEMSEISLQYLRPGDASVVSSDLGEVGAAIERADALLDLYLNHEDSGFYRASAANQEAFLMGIAASLTDVMPAPETIDKLVLIDSATPIAYIHGYPNPGLNRIEAKNPDQPLKITGTIEDVTIVDYLIDGSGRRYNSPDEMSTAKGGLGLVIRPQSCNFDMGGREKGNLIVVPIRVFEVLSLTMQ